MTAKTQIFTINSPASGVINNRKPWKILDESFEKLEDAYCSEETVRKRWGYRLIGGTVDRSQFRLSKGKTDANGHFEGVISDFPLEMGQRLLIGNIRITIVDPTPPGVILISPEGSQVTLDLTSRKLTIDGAGANQEVGFFPGYPVTGLPTRESEETNFEFTFGFDTKYYYEREGGFWTCPDPGTTWSGDDSNLFWWVNHRGPTGYERYIYVTNGYKGDPIRYMPEDQKKWTDLKPFLNREKTRTLDGCKFLVSFKDRLLAFDVYISENGVQRRHRNRVVGCQSGNPLQEDAWMTNIPGKGFYLDAPTVQAAVQPGYINDRLIIKFERKTFELVYTGHPNLPFKFQSIDDTLGAESTFSGITRQNVHVCIGNESINATNGVSVEDIDENIPREVYKIHNCCESVERVYGVHDNFSQLLYWTIPSKVTGSRFPARLIVYNYLNNSWAFFNDSFTCFGKFQKINDMLWRTTENFYPTWSVWNAPWNEGKGQSAFPDVIAGNQQGITFIIDNQRSINAPSLVITNISGNQLLVKDHNLQEGQYIGIEGYGDKIIIRVEQIIDDDNIVVDYTFPDGFKGNATITRMSKFDIFTKEFNFGTSVAKKIRIHEVHVLTTTTQNGKYIIDDIEDAALSNSTWDSTEDKDNFLGTNVMRTMPEELTPNRINTEYDWHALQTYAKGSFVQFRFTMSDEQMRDWLIHENPFVVHAIRLFVKPFGSSIERL